MVDPKTGALFNAGEDPGSSEDPYGKLFHGMGLTKGSGEWADDFDSGWANAYAMLMDSTKVQRFHFVAAPAQVVLGISLSFLAISNTHLMLQIVSTIRIITNDCRSLSTTKSKLIKLLLLRDVKIKSQILPKSEVGYSDLVPDQDNYDFTKNNCHMAGRKTVIVFGINPDTMNEMVYKISGDAQNVYPMPSSDELRSRYQCDK